MTGSVRSNWPTPSPSSAACIAAPASISSSRPNLVSLLDSLHLAQHALACSAATLPEGPDRRLLDRLIAPSTYKAMAETVQDAILPAIKGVRRNGRQFGGSSDHQTGLGRVNYKAQTTAPSDDLYIPLAVFLAWKPILGRVSSIVNCRKTSSLVEIPIRCRIPWKAAE